MGALCTRCSGDKQPSEILQNKTTYAADTVCVPPSSCRPLVHNEACGKLTGNAAVCQIVQNMWGLQWKLPVIMS